MEIKNRKFMQKYYFNIILKCSFCLIAVITLNSCRDVFEKRLAGDEVTVIIPNDQDTLYSNTVHFKWEELDGADSYRLQIVSPEFSNIQTFNIDSLIEGDEIKIVLAPGQYQFKLRGENSAYESDYIKARSIYVDSVNDLTNQAVQLLDPVDNIYTNSMQLSYFGWQNLFSASYYVFQIRTGSNFESGSLIHEESNIYGINYDFYQSSGIELGEGEYTWGIRAVNETSSSAFSARLLSVDTTAPNTPLLSSPANNFPSPTDQVTLKWSKNGSDPGIINSPLTSVVEISVGDSLFSNGSTTVFNNLTQDSLQYQFPNSGDYWWRVYLQDEAGNISHFYSDMSKLIIQ